MPQPDEVREFLINLPDEQYGEIFADVETVRLQRLEARLDSEPRPDPSDRDGVARWLAVHHLAIDPGIMEVLYLRDDSPPQDLHFVEINRLLSLPAREGEVLGPIDFGVDVDGSRFSLFVVDVSPTQLDLVRQGRLRLPDGWSLDGCRRFNREQA